MSNLKNILSVLIISGIVSISVWFSYRNALEKPLINTEKVVVDIPKGASFNTIVQILQNHEVEIQPLWFRLIAHLHRYAEKLQAGEYELKTGLTTLELLQMIAAGRVKQYSLTFPEGWCFRDMLRLLAKTPSLQHVLNSEDDPVAILKQIGIDKSHPEGWFFPDTYRYTKNTTDIALLKRAHLKMLGVLESEWQHKQQDLPLQDIYQALILASIIEKETALASERPQIAGVFVRRLQKGMLLQTDPTVIYGMGDAYQGHIRSKDLRTPTPYNTYVIPSLPPTPIAMPGLDAIRAALHPSSDQSLYFVAKGDGSHAFSTSLTGHNKAVARYLLNRRAQLSFNPQKHHVSLADYD